MTPIYILGGSQTDFAVNWTQQGKTIFDVLAASVSGSLAQADLAPAEVQVAHVGNFTAELFAGQGQLGGMVASMLPEWAALPTSRHEAACASGSIALLAAMAELQAGYYDVALVAGVELMRNVPAATAADHLGAAAWRGREAQNAEFPWVHLFSEIANEVERRYGLRDEHLARIAEINFGNGRRNPYAQARKWNFEQGSFGTDDRLNPIVEGRLRKQDCGRITDGSAAVILATEAYAHDYAKARGLSIEALPRIMGWGHRSAPLRLADKLTLSADAPYLFPHLRRAVLESYQRAGIAGVEALDVIETHDCFTITEYLALDHIGLTPPGENWRAIEDDRIGIEGDIPINPSGGLLAAGHPVGATGVRMVLDAAKQVTGKAGATQVEGAKRALTLNIGGSCTTVVTFVVGAEA
jgi:acetyl-CoA C-acetyltransferase